jgi:predicted membrane protein
MYKRLSQLSFVIGLFFSIVSLILFANIWLSNAANALNWYTSISFLVFGVAMMMIKNKEDHSQ